MAEVKWTRGFSRLYLVAVVVVYWGYWFVWKAFQGIQEAQQRGESADTNFPAQWGHMFREIVRTPGAAVGILLLPPVVGYGILLGILATARWVLRGFLASTPPKT
jgi:hypothetical protein